MGSEKQSPISVEEFVLKLSDNLHLLSQNLNALLFLQYCSTAEEEKVSEMVVFLAPGQSYSFGHGNSLLNRNLEKDTGGYETGR